MTDTTSAAPLLPSDAALSDVERLLARLVDDPATRDALLCAVELYGDTRADEARACI